MSGHYHCRTEAGLEATVSLNVVRSVRSENYVLTRDLRDKMPGKGLEPEMNGNVVSDIRSEVLRSRPNLLLMMMMMLEFWRPK